MASSYLLLPLIGHAQTVIGELIVGIDLNLLLEGVDGLIVLAQSQVGAPRLSQASLCLGSSFTTRCNRSTASS